MPVIFSKFAEYPNLNYGFSEKKDGSMERQQLANSEAYFKNNGLEPDRIVTAGLVHGSSIAIVGEDAVGVVIQNMDGLVTTSKNIFLSVTGADCFPVYFFDPVTSAVGIAHAGWRGILGGIVPNTIRAMTTHIGSHARDILVGIGPGIGVCHYEIRSEHRERYKDYPDFVKEREGRYFADLAGIISKQLTDAGIEQSRIEDCGTCTYHDENYFSARRDKSEPLQLGVGYIGTL